MERVPAFRTMPNRAQSSGGESVFVKAQSRHFDGIQKDMIQSRFALSLLLRYVHVVGGFYETSGRNSFSYSSGSSLLYRRRKRCRISNFLNFYLSSQ